jgi:hypothetical protein
MTGKGFLIFSLGVAVGTIVSTLVLKQRYEDILQEELESIREVQKRRIKGTTENNDDKDTTEKVENNDRQIIGSIIKNQEYGKYDTEEDYAERESPRDCDEENYDAEEDYYKYEQASKDANDVSRVRTRPYVISEEEFLNQDNLVGAHEQKTLYYYADGVLVEENEEIIDDIVGTIGENCLPCFDDSEESVIYVRNLRVTTDYEVIKLDTSYAEVVAGVNENVNSGGESQ